MGRTLTKFRQWTFTPVFRLGVDDDALEAHALRAVMTDVQVPSRIPAPVPVAVPVPPVVIDQLPSPGEADEFVTQLCNAHFRVQRSAREMGVKSQDSQEARRVTRAVENLDEFLRAQGIECLDLEGKPYDEGRLDFEAMAVDDSWQGDRPMIGRCERPLIKKEKRMLQKARGVVLRPAGR